MCPEWTLLIGAAWTNPGDGTCTSSHTMRAKPFIHPFYSTTLKLSKEEPGLRQMNNVTIPLWVGALMVAFLSALLSFFLSLLIRGRSRLIFRDIFYGAASPAIGVFVFNLLDVWMNRTISHAIGDNVLLLLLVCALLGYPILLLFMYMLKHPH